MKPTLEERLRAAIDSLPPIDSDEARSASGGLPSRQRRIIKVAVTATLVLATLAVVWLVGLRQTSEPKYFPTAPGFVVPWLSVPAPPMPAVTPPTTSTTTLAPAADCSSAGLRLRTGFTGAAAGSVETRIVVTNVGHTTCRLDDYPSVYGVTRGGRRVRLNVSHQTMFPSFVPADLRPGASGGTFIEGNDSCLGMPGGTGLGTSKLPYQSLSVVLPHGEGAISLSKFAPCGPLSVSQLGVPPVQTVSPAPAPGTIAMLRASSTLPNKLVGGTTAHFQVTLENPGPKSVYFRSCPGYTELLALVRADSVHVDKHSYMLHCKPVVRLAPGQSVTFAMEMPVSTVSRETAAKFEWGLDIGRQPLAPDGVYYSTARAVEILPGS